MQLLTEGDHGGENETCSAGVGGGSKEDTGLQRQIGVGRPVIYRCIDKALAAGFPRLARAGKSTVWRILDENEIKPHKIRYYLEKTRSGF